MWGPGCWETRGFEGEILGDGYRLVSAGPGASEQGRSVCWSARLPLRGEVALLSLLEEGELTGPLDYWGLQSMINEDLVKENRKLN